MTMDTDETRQRREDQVGLWPRRYEEFWPIQWWCSGNVRM